MKTKFTTNNNNNSARKIQKAMGTLDSGMIILDTHNSAKHKTIHKNKLSSVSFSYQLLINNIIAFSSSTVKSLNIVT